MQILIIAFLIFILPVTLLLFNFRLLLFDQTFYDTQFEDNRIYDQFERNFTWNATFALWEYLNFQNDELPPTYSARDQAHMVDVKELVHFARSLHIVLWILLTLAGVLLFFVTERNPSLFALRLQHVFMGSFLLFFIVSVLLFFLPFTQLFFSFHEALFTNDLWQLDPKEDLLIQLFPEAFFSSFFFRVVVRTLATMFFSLLLSTGIRLYLSNNEKNKKHSNRALKPKIPINL